MDSINFGRLGKGALSTLPEIISTPLDSVFVQKHCQAVLSYGACPTSEVRSAWINYLELVVEPVGWMAVWIPSPESADAFGCQIGRTGASLVEVRDINCSRLEAEVEMLRAPANWADEVPEVLSVAVAELYPIRHQDNPHINLEKTAEAVDLLRFFYKYLWRPWDENNCVDNWPETYLNTRINFHFDSLSKTGNHGIAERLEKLAREAEKNRDEITILEETAGLNESCDSVDEELAGRLGELHLRTEEIAREAEILEDPILRQMMGAGRMNKRRQKRKDKTPGITIVWDQGYYQDFSRVVELCGVECGGERRGLQVVDSVEHALEIAVPGDTIVIAAPGEHQITGLCDLSYGGKLVGYAGQVGGKEEGDREPAYTIKPLNTGDIFALIQGSVTMSNVILELGCGKGVGLQLSDGQLTLDNVKLKNCGTGIRMGEGSSAQLTGCTVEACTVGLHLADRAVLNISQSAIVDCDVGVQAMPGAVLSADHVTFRDNSDADIEALTPYSEVESAKSLVPGKELADVSCLPDTFTITNCPLQNIKKTMLQRPEEEEFILRRRQEDSPSIIDQYSPTAPQLSSDGSFSQDADESFTK